MSFESPSAADVAAIAATYGITLDAAQSAQFQTWLAPFVAGLRALDGMPEPLPEVKHRERSWRVPSMAENPYGAWYVRTEIPGAPRGPLAGWRVAIKDNLLVAGVPLANGTDFLDGCVPEFDATVVTRLLDAGGTIIGKAACEYMCVSGGSSTSRSGTVENPRKPGWSAGGSSSGSAALVAAGEVELGIACDQAGSVRIPSSLCGTVGMKATHGVVPYTGILGMEAVIDNCGPITATVAQNALALECMAGADGVDPRQMGAVVKRYTDGIGRGIDGLRIGVLREGFGHALSEPEVDECVRAAAAQLGRLGARVEEISIPEHPQVISVWAGLITDGLAMTLDLNAVPMNLGTPFSPAVHMAMERWRGAVRTAPPNMQVLVFLGRALASQHGRYYVRARNLRGWAQGVYDRALAGCDALLLPTTVSRARRHPVPGTPTWAEEVLWQSFNTVVNTAQFDATGHPALTLPCGLRDGLPVGLQLVGRHYDEPVLYRIGHAFEQSGDWQAR